MDDETQGRMPDETDATRVMPPDDEGATRVFSGEQADVTRVMPAAGGAPPPPPPIQPTLMMTRPKSPGSGTPWWVWLIVVLVVLAAAAAVWFFYLRPTDSTAGDEFIGNWSPEAMTGGGLVIARSGDQFKVTQYDGQLQATGSTVADLVDDTLEASVQASALGISGATGKVTATLTHEAASDRLKLQLTSGELQGKTVVFVRVEVLLPATPTPTPTPSPSLSPSPTLSPSPSVSPSPSGSASASADQQVIDGIAKLQVGIVTWATNNNNLYPMPQDVVEGGGISQFVDPWPTNPFTSQPMSPGTAPGGYVYEQLNGGQGYKLTGYLSNGLTYTVP